MRHQLKKIYTSTNQNININLSMIKENEFIFFFLMLVQRKLKACLWVEGQEHAEETAKIHVKPQLELSKKKKEL